MTLPTTTTLSGCDDDSDMFGPPRSSPPIGYHHHRSRVPMISPKLRQREERKRILQLCAHKLERIKDSETNLRRSVCINNTYCRLTDELRREKQLRYLANLPKSETTPETAHENIFNLYNNCGIDSSDHIQSASKMSYNDATIIGANGLSPNHSSLRSICSGDIPKLTNSKNLDLANSCNNNNIEKHNLNYANCNSLSNTMISIADAEGKLHSCIDNSNTNIDAILLGSLRTRKRKVSSNNVDTDLEILDRELNAINAPMPPIDPEITQGAEQLEKAVSSRKRLRSEDESDRLVREALSQFYIPPQQRLISAIEDCPLDVVGISMGLGVGVGINVGMNNVSMKRQKLSGNSVSANELELEFDMNQNQKEFEVIMDALRLGTPSPTPSNDSCGQAAMMSESANVFHNLVVTSLET